MKKLTCEMCGGTDLLKQEGVFVCQNCGIRYSVEEAKKMMVEGVVEVTGTVQIDNTGSVGNYLKIAQTALSSKNHAEAERYANRVIELDPSNYEAWLIKGKAAGWQSTLANLRFPECVSSFSAALSHAPQDQKERLMTEIQTEIANLSQGLIALRAERFVKWPDKEEGEGFLSDLSTIGQTVIDFASNGIQISIDGILSSIVGIIDDATKKAYHTTIYPDYKSDEYPYPDEHDWRRYVVRIDYCIQLLERAAVLCKKDQRASIQIWKDLIEFQNCAINSVSLDYKYIADEKVYYQKWKLSDEAKSIRKKKIAKYQAEIDSIKSQEEKEQAQKKQRETAIKNKKKSDFWSAHYEERNCLESELRKAEQKRDELIASGTGYVKCNMLNEYVNGILAVLSRERNATTLSDADKNMLRCANSFWPVLSALDEYDAYLDNNPILKQSKELATKRNQIIQKKTKLAVQEWKFLASFLALTAVGVTMAVGAEYLDIGSELVSFLSWIVMLMSGACFVYYLFNRCLPNLKMRRVYKKEVKAYNTIVDKMNDVPKYTGQMSKTLKYAMSKSWTPHIPSRIEE